MALFSLDLPGPSQLFSRSALVVTSSNYGNRSPGPAAFLPIRMSRKRSLVVKRLLRYALAIADACWPFFAAFMSRYSVGMLRGPQMRHRAQASCEPGNAGRSVQGAFAAPHRIRLRYIPYQEFHSPCNRRRERARNRRLCSRIQAGVPYAGNTRRASRRYRLPGSPKATRMDSVTIIFKPTQILCSKYRKFASLCQSTPGRPLRARRAKCGR
jgi:hypothetical protein